jgi:hypothetical protein
VARPQLVAAPKPAGGGGTGFPKGPCPLAYEITGRVSLVGYALPPMQRGSRGATRRRFRPHAYGAGSPRRTAGRRLRPLLMNPPCWSPLRPRLRRGLRSVGWSPVGMGGMGCRGEALTARKRSLHKCALASLRGGAWQAAGGGAIRPKCAPECPCNHPHPPTPPKLDITPKRRSEIVASSAPLP